MIDETLKKIRASKGWEDAVHGNLALTYIGAGGCADMITSKDPNECTLYCLFLGFHIQKARNQYNRYVGKLNTHIESFPASLIASRFGFEKQNYFTLELATQRELPEVGFFKFKIPESKSKK